MCKMSFLTSGLFQAFSLEVLESSAGEDFPSKAQRSQKPWIQILRPLDLSLHTESNRTDKICVSPHNSSAWLQSFYAEFQVFSGEQ